MGNDYRLEDVGNSELLGVTLQVEADQAKKQQTRSVPTHVDGTCLSLCVARRTFGRAGSAPSSPQTAGAVRRGGSSNSIT